MFVSPDQGETLALYGDAITFADGASIVPHQETLIISNAVSVSGTLNIGLTNMTYSGKLPTNSYVTLFKDVRIDDISPVSGHGSSRNNKDLTAFNIVRDGDALRVELQALDGTYVKGSLVELKQSGSDVAGKLLLCGHLGSSSAYMLGAKMWTDSGAKQSYTTSYAKDALEYTLSSGYGVNKITVGPRRDTFRYAGTLFSTSFDTIVATNIPIDEIEIVCGSSSVKNCRGFPTRTTIKPQHVAMEDGVLSAQLQNISDGYTKCVKIQLKQIGNDICARSVYARYISNTNRVYNFDTDASTSYTLATESNYDADKFMYGIDTLVLRRTSRSKVSLAVSGTLDLAYPITGAGAEVTFEATAAAVVNATGTNTLSDSAYVIKGDAEHTMDFRATPSQYAIVLPSTTDAYGTNTVLRIRGYNKPGSGGSAGKSAIAMHPGSRLVTETQQAPFDPDDSTVLLDNATLELSTGTGYNNHLGHLTLSNASVVCGSRHLMAGYQCSSSVYRVSGTGASTNGCQIVLWTSGNDLTLDVEETVEGAEADFVMTNNIANNGDTTAVIIKTGAGTMLMNGQFQNTANANRILGGEIRLGVSDAVASGGSFSLEGGTLGIAAGTANTVAAVDVTADGGISCGAGATLTIASLTLGEDVETFAIASANGECPVTVGNALDEETLAKIKINGKRVVQTSDGRLVGRGLVISIR